MKKLQRRFAPTPAALPRNKWPVCSGITGRFQRNTHPKTPQHIAAIISIAGVSNGSPFADDFYEFYRDWLAGQPVPGCGPGTGEEVRDLRRDVRLEWWRRNRSAIMPPMFSIVAAADRVSPVLLPTYAKLASIDPRNDARLLWYDAVVPRGYLLGYVNADHLAIVVPASQQMPALSFLFKDNVPRAAPSLKL